MDFSNEDGYGKEQPMKMILAVIIGALLWFAACIEFANYSVYHGFIEEEKLDVFFDKYLETYTINNYDRSGNLLNSEQLKPFLSTHLSFLSRWHIHGYGRIPRWSKWSNKIQEHRDALYVKPKPKDLLDEIK